MTEDTIDSEVILQYDAKVGTQDLLCKSAENIGYQRFCRISYANAGSREFLGDQMKTLVPSERLGKLTNTLVAKGCVVHLMNQWFVKSC